MATKRQPIVLVSSAVYGFEDLLDRVYAVLVTFGRLICLGLRFTNPDIIRTFEAKT